MNREFAKGLAKVKENDFLAAIEHFTLAIQEDTNNVECYAERAVAYLNTNQFDLSMFDMHRCIEMEPNNSYRYSCRAFLKAKIGDTEGAIADYEMAVKLDPEDAIAYNNLGLVQETKGFRVQAQKSFEKSNELIGYNPNRFDEGVLKKEVPEKKSVETDKKEEYATEAIQTATESNSSAQVQSEESINPSKGQIAKNVFTSRSGFKDFWKFIRNGFRIKE
jgi:Flp pilus assembly protein TadD